MASTTEWHNELSPGTHSAATNTIQGAAAPAHQLYPHCACHTDQK